MPEPTRSSRSSRRCGVAGKKTRGPEIFTSSGCFTLHQAKASLFANPGLEQLPVHLTHDPQDLKVAVVIDTAHRVTRDGRLDGDTLRWEFQGCVVGDVPLLRQRVLMCVVTSGREELGHDATFYWQIRNCVQELPRDASIRMLDLGGRTTNPLLKKGIKTIGDVLEFGRRDSFLTISMIGPANVAQLEEKMRLCGHPLP